MILGCLHIVNYLNPLRQMSGGDRFVTLTVHPNVTVASKLQGRPRANSSSNRSRREGLINQVTLEGFTNSQAEYGVISTVL